jgi:hypothetical protein
MDDLYTEDNSPRWILKVISEFNLMLLKELSKEGRLKPTVIWDIY